jgi:hypothetical protein
MGRFMGHQQNLKRHQQSLKNMNNKLTKFGGCAWNKKNDSEKSPYPNKWLKNIMKITRKKRYKKSHPSTNDTLRCFQKKRQNDFPLVASGTTESY